jgi:hypothetical protein
MRQEITYRQKTGSRNNLFKKAGLLPARIQDLRSGNLAVNQSCLNQKVFCHIFRLFALYRNPLI